MKHCPNCKIDAHWNTADCPICLGMLEDRSSPKAGLSIPADVAVCPECGGHLTLTEDFDTEGDDNPAMDCENEPDIDGNEEDFHRFWQSDWQPVIDKVSAHLRGQNDKIHPTT